RYGHDNVCLCRIQKPGAFLHFTFEGNSAERLHLLSRTAADREQLADKIATLSAKGFSQRDISQQLNIGLATVNRLLRYPDPPMTNDVMTNDQHADALMTNDVMTNDQIGCADMQMRGCADGEECADGDVHGDALMTNDIMTNDQKKAAALCDSLPWEGREGYSEPIITYEERADGEHTPAQFIQSPLMTNDQKEATQHIKLNPDCDRKTSTIDKLLTPELLDQILRTTTCEKASAQIPFPPDYLAPTSAKQS
ncbi:MAG: hypothetical protein JWR09_5538, partial [Mucilaginibacter sp.]|nr:hypothetical protein [Mucilaginibacter sp.]